MWGSNSGMRAKVLRHRNWAPTACASFFFPWMGWLTAVGVFVTIKRRCWCEGCLRSALKAPAVVCPFQTQSFVHGSLVWELEPDVRVCGALGRLSSLPLTHGVGSSQKDCPLNFTPFVFINKKVSGSQCQEEAGSRESWFLGYKHLHIPKVCRVVFLIPLLKPVWEVSLRDRTPWMCTDWQRPFQFGYSRLIMENAFSSYFWS